MKRFYHDCNGAMCGRKLFGTIITSISIILGVFLFWVDLTVPDIEFDYAYRVFVVMITVGASMLGLNILDSIKDAFTRVGR
jgi:hypothetical protein